MPSDPPPPPPGAPPGGGPPGESASGGGPPEVSFDRFARPRALHPASIVLGVPLRQLIQGLLFPVIVGASAAPSTIGLLVVLGVVVLLGLVVRFLAWQRFRFSFDGEVLRVDEGVLSRNHRALDVARIQQVEVNRSLLARLLGLATLRVETAGGSGEPEVELRVIPDADAEALRTAVRASKAAVQGGGVPADGTAEQPGDTDAGDDVEDRTVLRVGLPRILLASVTGSRLLVLPAVLAAGLQFLGDATELGGGNLDPETLARRVIALGVVGVLTLLVPASFVVASAAGVLRDFGWTMRRSGDDLHVSRGLLSTRQSVVPLARVQLVEVHRNWIRRALGLAVVRVHSAGGAGESRVTIPLLRSDEVDHLVGELLPGVDGVPPLEAHPPTARRRAVFRWVRAALVPSLALLLIPNLPDQLRVVGALVPVVAAVLGLVEYSQLAHGRSARVVAGRSGALSVTTGLAPLVKVQGVSRRASWFQRRLGLATLTVHVAGPGGDLEVLDLAADRGAQLHDELVVAASDPIVPEELADDPEAGVLTAPEP
jgi:putative membrane protein